MSLCHGPPVSRSSQPATKVFETPPSADQVAQGRVETSPGADGGPLGRTKATRGAVGLNKVDFRKAGPGRFRSCADASGRSRDTLEVPRSPMEPGSTHLSGLENARGELDRECPEASRDQCAENTVHCRPDAPRCPEERLEGSRTRPDAARTGQKGPDWCHDGPAVPRSP